MSEMESKNIKQNNDKMLIITERFYPEEFLINELAQYWHKNHFNIEVLTQFPTYPFGKIYNNYANKIISAEEELNIKTYRVFTITGYKNNKLKKILHFLCFILFASLYGILKGKKYNRIFVYHVGALTTAIPAVIIKKMYNRKITIWTQDIWPNTICPKGFNGFGKKMLLFFLNSFVKYIYRNCNDIVVSCEPFIEKIKKYVPKKKIYYCPNWPTNKYDETMFPAQFLSSKINFIFAGNINKWRNLDKVILCFNKYNQNTRKAQLNIIGDGSGLSSLKNLVKKNNIKNVVFWGRKPSSEMNSYYKGSDVLIISLADNPCYSLYLPAKFSAYLETGKPIFAITYGPVHELVKRYKVGISVLPDDQESIINGFVALSSFNDNQKEQIKNMSKILLADHFNKKEIMNELTNIVFS